MSEPERDFVDLPEAPSVAPSAREHAIAQALTQFDAQHSDQGFRGGARPRSREASWMESVMVRHRAALAATAIVVVASPIAWMIAQERAAEMPSPTAQPKPSQVLPRPAGEAAVSVDRPVQHEPQSNVAPSPPVMSAETEKPATPVATDRKSVVPPIEVPPSPAMLAQADKPAASAMADQKFAPPPQVAPKKESAAAASAPLQNGGRPDGSYGRAPHGAVPAPVPPPSPYQAKAEVMAKARDEARAKAEAEISRDVIVEALARPAPQVRSVPSGRVSELFRAPSGYSPNYAPERIAPPSEPIGNDRFEGKQQSGFKSVQESPVSTFSIDVDTASYGFLRASLNRNALPQKDAVRTEELINYFPYSYPVPSAGEAPFSVSATVYPSPWAEGRKILRVGIKGYEIPAENHPKANLVFLIDTSGSMNGPNRLPLVKQALSLLLTKLGPEDRIAIVAYAGQAGTVLEPTPANETSKILSAIEGLGAGGGTAGGEGLRQAYALAERNFDPKAVNRVMLATDGDFNIGITSQDELKGFVERKREKGIFLSVLGFGMGNYNDALMQTLAQNGNGTAATIDTLSEARKVLVEEASATLFPIAKDVKIQVEFNPAAVTEYRLIGYETRALNRDDFENDKVDAGEVGAGQSATALYEFVPAGGARTIAPLRYGPQRPQAASPEGEYAFVKIRYKKPDQDMSQLIETPVGAGNEAKLFTDADEDARFATAVAGFGEILRGGKWTGKLKLDDVLKMASAARGEDPYGYRSEFLQLVRAAKTAQALQSSRQ